MSPDDYEALNRRAHDAWMAAHRNSLRVDATVQGVPSGRGGFARTGFVGNNGQNDQRVTQAFWPDAYADFTWEDGLPVGAIAEENGRYASSEQLWDALDRAEVPSASWPGYADRTP